MWVASGTGGSKLQDKFYIVIMKKFGLKEEQEIRIGVDKKHTAVLCL
jgi:hypothetical protein